MTGTNPDLHHKAPRYLPPGAMPEAAGWWWVRDEDEEWGIVELREEGLIFGWTRRFVGSYLMHDLDGCEWFGPLEPPRFDEYEPVEEAE